eukprot:m.48979 g.48979  ORF g.48979 m.48979 type:complete len:56 (+) comp11437_c0_seq1:174-341(+)
MPLSVYPLTHALQAASECVWEHTTPAATVATHLASLCADMLAGGAADVSASECMV